MNKIEELLIYSTFTSTLGLHLSLWFKIITPWRLTGNLCTIPWRLEGRTRDTVWRYVVWSVVLEVIVSDMIGWGSCRTLSPCTRTMQPLWTLEDVSLVAQGSFDRLERFTLMSERWSGPKVSRKTQSLYSFPHSQSLLYTIMRMVSYFSLSPSLSLFPCYTSVNFKGVLHLYQPWSYYGGSNAIDLGSESWWMGEC